MFDPDIQTDNPQKSDPRISALSTVTQNFVMDLCVISYAKFWVVLRKSLKFWPDLCVKFVIIEIFLQFCNDALRNLILEGRINRLIKSILIMAINYNPYIEWLTNLMAKSMLIITWNWTNEGFYSCYFNLLFDNSKLLSNYSWNQQVNQE